MGKEIVQYGDAAMYESQPILRTEEGARVTPRVFLLNAMPDPLGTIAADMRMYRGDPVYSLSEITDEQRVWAWEEVMKTKLNTPLEGVVIKFMFEAVTRSFTHQLVRQRVGAYYVQESLRFAVKRGLANEVALPPHVVEGTEAYDLWSAMVAGIQSAYEGLIAAGIPAEDARGLLPHAVTTRVIYQTNLRALFEEAAKRLCTQAQFEWRYVFLEVMKAIREFQGNTYEAHEPGYEGDPFLGHKYSDNWQWKIIATPLPKSFAPACYHTGSCQFLSMLDRGCTIRDRVQAFAATGVPPERWAKEGEGDPHGIDPDEWMANANAGVTTPSNARPE